MGVVSTVPSESSREKHCPLVIMSSREHGIRSLSEACGDGLSAERQLMRAANG